MNENNINNIFLDDIINNCGHYTRGCRLLAPCCNKLFDCRFCHDVEMDDNEKDVKKQHKMINSEVKMMVCRKCSFLQKFAQYCEACDFCMGTYYCEICKFVDTHEVQKYFHCDKCGICRRGTTDEYKHCDDCGCCFEEGHFASSEGQPLVNKKCVANRLDTNCPICFEELFTSTTNPFPMSCGHMIHINCFNQYVRTNDTCPLCRKTIYKNKMRDIMIKMAIAQTPMPEEYRDKKVDIMCNDCGEKSNVVWHIIAMFCPHCDSHNTKQI
jgi:RING finger/CHY zinc finger protein 1